MNWTKEEQEKHRNLVADALESGEYQQCIGTLKDGNEFCCLGVACDVFKKETGKGKWNDTFFMVDSEASQICLVTEVRSWLGLKSDEGFYQTDKGLTTHNDDDGWTFEEIAKLFRDPPEGLVDE